MVLRMECGVEAQFVNISGVRKKKGKPWQFDVTKGPKGWQAENVQAV
jgi:cold shock CspA family protein